MKDKTYNALFICTGNSARSILAEGLLDHLGRGRFNAFSAGSQPKGTVNELALRTLQHFGFPVEGYRSKSWNDFAGPDSPPLDFVITVCDRAAGEACPVWPGQPVTAHWGIPDPAAVGGTDEQRRQAFLDTAVLLKHRIELMLALPMASLDKLSLQQAVRDIGHR